MGIHSHFNGDCSSQTASPSVIQCGIRLSVAARVIVCVYSCRSTCDQLNAPIVASPLRGETIAITRPVLAPTVPIHGEPVVLTENASCVGKTSIYVLTGGSFSNVLET